MSDDMVIVRGLSPDARPSWSDVTSAGIFRVEPGGRFDRHFHDCDEYWLVFSGRAVVAVGSEPYPVEAGDIVITADIPLASRCMQKGARAIGSTGRPFTEDNIGEAVATRDLLAVLRGGGEITGGPPPLEKRDRSQFLQVLDQTIQAIRRSQT